jgi:hypothetical protein
MEKRIISFNEELHRYTDEYNVVYTSVTQKIGSIEKKFQTEFWSIYRALDQLGYKVRPFPEHDSIEINKCRYDYKIIPKIMPDVKLTTTNVNTEWDYERDSACEWGTSKHSYLEDCVNRISPDSEKIVYSSNLKNLGFKFKVTNLNELEHSPLKVTYPAIYDILKQLIDGGYTLYAEKRVYSAQHRIAGTIDLLAVKGNKFYIVDWKTNKDKLKFVSGYYKKAWNSDRTKKIKTSEFIATNDTFLKPINDIPACKGNIYMLQLSLYALLCEMWGLECLGLILCHIRPLMINDVVQLNADGSRIELPPEIYQMRYAKDEAYKVLTYNIK